MKSLLRATLLAFVLFPYCSVAATLYVATTGSDSSGDGSSTRPWKTIGFGLGKLASSDTLVVRSGIYQGVANFINAGRHSIPDGVPGKPTIIKAEVPFGVRVKNSGSLDYYDSEVLLTGSYVQIDGIVFEMNDVFEPEYNIEIGGHHNKLTRVLVRRTGATSPYGGWISIQGNDNLVEDCAGVGSARYGFKIGGPTSSTARNIFRRCVGRVDYSNSDQPKATFAVYGNDTGSGVRDVLFQNCIAVDSRRGPTNGEQTYGGFYNIKNATNVTIQGSIVLNVESAYAGYFLKEQQAQGIRIENSVAWGGYGAAGVAGIRANGSTGSPLLVNHVTIGGYGTALYNRDSAQDRILRNSLFVGNSALSANDFGWTVATNNAFSPSAPTIGSRTIVGFPAPKYIVRTEQGSALAGAGDDGADVGANVTRRYGRSGTLWGESGFDQLTTDSLWPWENESYIKQVFMEPHSPPSGAVPTTNDSTRGFCASLDRFGRPMTLSRYVWQFLGNEIPAEIYGASGAVPLTAPTGVSATVIP